MTASRTAPNPGRATKRTGPRIGEMLLARGFIDDDQLDAALQEQKRSGERLGTVLVTMGALSELDLCRVLAEHTGFEFVDLEERTVDPATVQLVKESFARYHQLLPVSVEESGHLHVAMVNPANVFSLDDLRAVTGRDVIPFMAEATQLLRAIDRVWGAADVDEAILRIEQEAAPEDVANLEAAVASEDAPVIQFVNQIISRAVTERASDVHFEANERDMRVRFRIDGVLHEVMNVPRAAQAAVVSRLKIMSEINIAERRIPQDGRVSLSMSGRPVSLRVVTLPTAYGESVIIRVLEESEGIRDLPELGIDDHALEVYEAAFRRPWGAILVTGPTGAGKSTTMYATVAELNDVSRNIITVEDPIEYRIPGLKQVQVNRKAGLTFANALRAILRADPDVVMVGEVRDVETAHIAVEAALTGHMVITSLHTNNAASTPARLLDMGVEPFMVSSALNAIVAQRLARRLCERCRAVHDPTADEGLVAMLPDWALEGGHEFRRPVGCNACSGTGFHGRLAVMEVMEVTDEIGQLIAHQAVPREVHRVAVEQGMLTLREDGLRKAAAGLTSLEEVLRAVG